MPDELNNGIDPAADTPAAGGPDDDPFDPWEGQEPEDVWPEAYRLPVARLIEIWANRDPGASMPIFGAIRAGIAGWIDEDLPGWRALVVGDDVFALQPGPVPPQVPPAFALAMWRAQVDVYACAYTGEAYEEDYDDIMPAEGPAIHAAYLGSVELADPGMFDRLARLLLWPDGEPSETEYCPRDDIRDAVYESHRVIREFNCRTGRDHR